MSNPWIRYVGLKDRSVKAQLRFVGFSTVKVKRLIDVATASFKLGKLVNFRIIIGGYQDLNIKLITTKGIYFLKIFSKNRLLREVKDQVRAYKLFSKKGIATVQLLKWGKYGGVCMLLLKWIEGKSLGELSPNRDQVLTIVQCLARIHRLSARIKGYYDSWGPAALVKEFDKYGNYLSKRDKKLIAPVGEALKNIDLKLLPQSTIHGTPERENILVDTGGNITLLDLGCLAYNARIIDLAVFIAFTCFRMRSKREDIAVYRNAVKSYGNFIKLTLDEKKVLPVLVRAAYASVIVGVNYFMKRKKFISIGLNQWLVLSRRGLRKFPL